MWKFQHLDGQREINELHVPVGRAVKLIMTSEDVIHDLFVPAFRVKADVLPGRYTQHLVPADEARPLSPVLRGVLRHAPFGNDRRGHRHGAERVPGVAERRRHRKDRSRQPAKSCSPISPATPAIVPTRRAAARCSTDLFGKTVTLRGRRDGRRRRGVPPRIDSEPDARRSRPAIQPIMPTFQGLVTEEELLELIEYVKSLQDAAAGAPRDNRADASASTASLSERRLRHQVVAADARPQAHRAAVPRRASRSSSSSAARSPC